MSKNPIKVVTSFLSGEIEAGRVNPSTNMFVGNRDVVTDSAIDAVATYLVRQDVHILFNMNDKKYKLQAVEVIDE